MSEARYFLGLDGGATRCRLRLRDKQGRKLAEETGGAANIYVDFDGGLARVQALAELVMRTAGIPLEAQNETAFGLGLAGLSSEQDARRLAAALTGWANVKAVNDAVTACIGGSGIGDGGLIIAGTGAAGIARVAGKATIVGGRGFYLGDDGSGARIGADAARAAMRAYDGLQPMTELSRQILAHFDDDVIAMMRWALDAKPGDYGAFAPKAFAAAEAGDGAALEIVERAAEAIATLVRRVAVLGAPRIAFVGGVAEPLRAYLPAEISARLHPPEHDAIDGAILMMGGGVADERGRP